MLYECIFALVKQVFFLYWFAFLCFLRSDLTFYMNHSNKIFDANISSVLLVKQCYKDDDIYFIQIEYIQKNADKYSQNSRLCVKYK